MNKKQQFSVKMVGFFRTETALFSCRDPLAKISRGAFNDNANAVYPFPLELTETKEEKVLVSGKKLRNGPDHTIIRRRWPPNEFETNHINPIQIEK